MLGFWQGKAPLMLASKSASRQALLAAAGIPFEAIASAIDERAVEAPLLASKAHRVSRSPRNWRAQKRKTSRTQQPGRLVIGADQTLVFEGRLFAKPTTIARSGVRSSSAFPAAAMSFIRLCLSRVDGTIAFETVVTARLTCRAFGAEFVDRYIAVAGEAVLLSVGAYQIEGLGIHLFDKIDGDHATILGLPLLPLLAFLRREGFVAG